MKGDEVVEAGEIGTYKTLLGNVWHPYLAHQQLVKEVIEANATFLVKLDLSLQQRRFKPVP